LLGNFPVALTTSVLVVIVTLRAIQGGYAKERGMQQGCDSNEIICYSLKLINS